MVKEYTDPALVERLYLACLAREPEFWLAVDLTDDDIHPSNAWGRAFLKSGLELLESKQGIEPKLINIVRHGVKYDIPDISFFQQLGLDATEEIRLDFLDIQLQVKLEARRRLTLAELFRAQERVATCSIFELAEVSDEAQTNLARIDMADDKNEDHDLGSVIETFADRSKKSSAPMPTRWKGFNRMVGGGLYVSTIWSFTGAPGARKTTFAVYNLALDWAEAGYRIYHAAIDGGDKFQQGVRYLTVLWEKECFRAGIERPPSGMLTVSFHNGVEWREVPYVRPMAVRQILRPDIYGKVPYEIPKDAYDAFWAALERMKAFKVSNDGGWVRMYDAGDIEDADAMHRQLRIHQRVLGIDAFVVDHVGVVDGQGRSELEKRAYVTDTIVRFVQRNKSRAVALAQRTQSANYGDQKDTDNPGMAYGQKLHQASTMVGAAIYDSAAPFDMEIALLKNRDDEAGNAVRVPFRIIPSSGYIYER